MTNILRIIYENSYKVVGVVVLVYMLLVIIGWIIAILESLIIY